MAKKYDGLGERMKTYEAVPKNFLTLGTPKVVRLDMRAGHTFCRNFKVPFDDVFSACMEAAAVALCEEIPGVVMAYTQSDEISLILNDITRNGKIMCFFDGNVEKIVSITASICTRVFERKYQELVYNSGMSEDDRKIYEPNVWKANFDSRVFSLPNVKEVHNYMLWRQNDATRNSIQMAGHAEFTDSELHLKNTSDIQDMLMLQRGINWNNYPPRYKRGFVILKEQYEKDVLVEKTGELIKGVKRTRWVVADIPVLTQEPAFVKKVYNRYLLSGGKLIPSEGTYMIENRD